MIVKSIPSTWIVEEEHRLDCGPFVKGSIEARKTIEGLPCVKDRLVEVTKGGLSGMYHVGQDKILWVESEEHGIPFIRSSDIMKVDFSYQSLISRRQVAANPLFQCPEGATLVTRSGTIGRMAFMRSDMVDAAISQDVLKVVPDERKIRSGYLYAFLSSKYGLPIITGGTFGSIIVHIEAENIADLPVPRLGELEKRVHDLVELAASKRVSAGKLVVEATNKMMVNSGLPKLTTVEGIPFGVNAVQSSNILERMDGAFHSQHHHEVISRLKAAKAPPIAISAISKSVIEPNRFKRIEIQDAEFGIPFFGTTALMWSDPKPSYLIPKNMSGVEDLIVKPSTVLVPRSGQISGIIGTPVLPYGELIGGAVSEHAIRVNCANENIAGYVFIALNSEYGRRQLKARAYGSSIPSLDIWQIKSVQIPNLGEQGIKEIGSLGVRSAKLRHEAIHYENQARTLVERAIEAEAR